MGRVLPWCGWEEWRHVKSLLTSEDAVQQCLGIDRVSAWRVRTRLPLALDVTAALLEAAHQDAARTGRGPPPEGGRALSPGALCAAPPSDHALRLQYALALIRMVNGIVDSQQRGKVAASVAGLAASVGLPRLLVDLRHEATHNELPTLAALRVAAAQALAWLRAEYWERQEAHLDACMARVSELVARVCGSCEAAARKAQQGRRFVGGSDDGSGDEAAASGGEGDDAYTAAAGRKERQQLMSELRQHVPGRHAALLVPAVLMRLSSAGRPAQAHGAAAAPLPRARGAPAGDDANTRAAAAVLRLLSKAYSSLPALLLEEAVAQLCLPPGDVAAAPPGGGAPPPRRLEPAALLRCLALLLPAGAHQADWALAPPPPKRRKGAPAQPPPPPSPGAAEPPPPADRQLLQRLQAMLLRAAPAAAASAQPPGAGRQLGAWREALLSAAAMVAASLEPAAGDGAGGRGALLVRLAEVCVVPGQASDRAGRAAGGEDGAGVEAAGQLQRELLSKWGARGGAAAEGAPPEGGSAPRGGGEDAGRSAAAVGLAASEGVASRGGGRWRRVGAWSACPVGCLPGRCRPQAPPSLQAEPPALAPPSPPRAGPRLCDDAGAAGAPMDPACARSAGGDAPPAHRAGASPPLSVACSSHGDGSDAEAMGVPSPPTSEGGDLQLGQWVLPAQEARELGARVQLL